MLGTLDIFWTVHWVTPVIALARILPVTARPVGFARIRTDSHGFARIRTDSNGFGFMMKLVPYSIARGASD